MKGVPWTNSQEQTLADMWADGKSLGMIAGVLGFTRSAVAGKMQRLRLDKRPTAERVKRIFPPCKPRAKRISQATARQRPSAPILRALPDIPYDGPLVTIDHLGEINAPDGPGPVALLKLRPSHCRRPLWGVVKPATVDGFMFCGAPTVGGSYCASCAPKMSYVPTASRSPVRITFPTNSISATRAHRGAA